MLSIIHVIVFAKKGQLFLYKYYSVSWTLFPDQGTESTVRADFYRGNSIWTWPADAMDRGKLRRSQVSGAAERRRAGGSEQSSAKGLLRLTNLSPHRCPWGSLSHAHTCRPATQMHARNTVFKWEKKLRESVHAAWCICECQWRRTRFLLRKWRWQHTSKLSLA